MGPNSTWRKSRLRTPNIVRWTSVDTSKVRLVVSVTIMGSPAWSNGHRIVNIHGDAWLYYNLRALQLPRLSYLIIIPSIQLFTRFHLHVVFLIFKRCTMATVDILVGLSTDISKHATTPTMHRDAPPGQAATGTSPSEPTLKQLTIEEKVQLLSGIDFVSTGAVPRVGIPGLKVGLNTVTSRHDNR